MHFATGRCCENVILVITRWPLLPATVTTGQCGELLYPPPPMASEFGKSLIKYPSPEIFKFLNNNNDYASILPTKGQIFPGPPLSCPGVLPPPCPEFVCLPAPPSRIMRVSFPPNSDELQWPDRWSPVHCHHQQVVCISFYLDCVMCSPLAFLVSTDFL